MTKLRHDLIRKLVSLELPTEQVLNAIDEELGRLAATQAHHEEQIERCRGEIAALTEDKAALEE